MSTHRKSSNIALWILQGLLAALFLFAGGAKLAMPTAELARVSHLSGEFLKFIAVCEVLGGLGLVFRVRVGLTPLAATGLVVIMVGAVVVSVLTQGVASAALPLVVGALVALVAFSRRPSRPRTTFAH